MCPQASQTRNYMLLCNNALARTKQDDLIPELRSSLPGNRLTCPRRMNAKLILPPQLLSLPEQQRTIVTAPDSPINSDFRIQGGKRVCLT
jgi:hypothetical protein